MKLRIIETAVRLRIDRSELRQLLRHQPVERHVNFGGSSSTLTYALHPVNQESVLRAAFSGGRMDFYVDATQLETWAASQEAGLEADQAGGPRPLKLLLEKDFPCAHGNVEDAEEKFTPATMQVQATAAGDLSESPTV